MGLFLLLLNNFSILKSVFIHETAIVEDGVTMLEGCKVWHFAQVREGAKLGRNVILSKSSYIDTGVVIGNNVKIQNLVSVYNGVTIGNDVFIGPHVVFTNDLYPRALGTWDIVSTVVMDGVSIGANATILCGISIGKHALIAAGSVVIRDVPEHGFVAGNPAQLKGYVCECARKILPATTKPGSYSQLCSHCNRTNKIKVE